MSFAATVARIVNRYGATYTLRRDTPTGGAPNAWTQGTPHAISYFACKGRQLGYSARDLRGAMQEEETSFTIDAASLAATPRDGDKIALGTFTADAGAQWLGVVNVAPVFEGAAIRVYVLTLRR